MEFLLACVATVERGLIGWMVVAGVLTTLEILNPLGPMPMRRRLMGMTFWLASIPVSAVLVTAFGRAWKAWGVQPLLTLPAFQWVAWTGPLAGVLAIVVAAVINDFFFYAYHRIQHRWLWRFHAVHHSIRDLTAINSYHHISETLMGLVLLTLPTSLIVADVGAALPYANLLLWLHIVWIHSPTRFSFGPLRAAFCDNRFHRIHHSLEERHFDKNFGAFTTLWDRLFGTAYFPTKDEWPAVGLAEVGEPKDLREWLDLPGRYRAATDPAERPAQAPVVA